MALAAVKWAISSRTILKHLFPIQNGALYCVCHKTTYSSLPDDYNCKVELALTSDGRTIVCYHPSVDIPYEHTKSRRSLLSVHTNHSTATTLASMLFFKPIPRPDPVQNNEETHDLVLKTRLEEKGEHLEQGPMIEQLSKMFFTTKHRWYPRGHLSFRSKLQQQLPTFPIKVKGWKYFCLIKQPQFQRDTQTEHLPCKPVSSSCPLKLRLAAVGILGSVCLVHLSSNNWLIANLHSRYLNLKYLVFF
eukprot:XP_028346242.1 39S ribosomal protein L42, mitochondrial isoform X1 [Physeter catodon]